MTHNNMGTSLVKLNEIVGKILKVKNVSKMFKNHAKRSLCKRWDMHKKVDLKKSILKKKSQFG
jgi:hypothetical protein